MSMWKDLQPGDPQLIGPYAVRGQLGAGGMGRVFLGLSAGGQQVAVKIIRADLAMDPEFRARFQREVAVARKVSGRFTAPVIDADLDGPVPWLATAYVAGPSLADAVAERGPLPVRSLVRLARGLAEGLNVIHTAGVVHRDLKPSNVLLAEDGPRIIDVGISQGAEGSALTRTGLVVGSPGFLSPEQAEGHPVGPPSDIFSLGAVLAFAATGEGPFGAGSAPTLCYRVVHSPASVDHVPADVRLLVERCLAKDPGARPTARDLMAETGAGQPASSRLTAPVTRTAIDPPALAGAPRTVTSVSLFGVSRPDAGQPDRRGGRHRRHRWRPLAIASVAAGLLAASAAGGFALTASPHQSPGVRSGQAVPVAMTSSATSAQRAPAGQVTSALAAATPGTSAPVNPPSMSPSATPSASMPVSPAPSASMPVSAAPSASTAPAPAAPTPSGGAPTAAPTPSSAAS